jgi:hypothetical protein
MNFDLNINNYSKDDYMDIFNLDKSMNPSKETVETNYKDVLNYVSGENLDPHEKKNIQVFLLKCKNNLLGLLKLDKEPYKLINTKFMPDLNSSETFKSNDKFIIKKQTDVDKFHTNKINPFAKIKKTQLLNINTKFRKRYYDTCATDFIVDLPEEFKNVISLTVQSVQVPNSNYTFSSKLGSNEFSLELFIDDDYDSPFSKTYVIKITDGIYTGKTLEDYLNTYVLNEFPLSCVACKYDDITRKFRFFRDNRPAKDGGNDISNCTFNIDWRIKDDQNRPIQLNMGWILGYRQQYYKHEDDYIGKNKVNYNKQEGYNPEAVYDTLGSNYYILSIDDFNKNYSNTLTSPFQESMFTNQNAIAKIPNNANLQQLDDIFYQSKREYFGPVNIKKLHIKLLDELGRVVDLNNNDFSFSVQIEQLYDVHANKILN